MDAFRTVVTPQKPGYSITHNDKLLSVGSCFSENVGKKFQHYKFDININPFGQQYNPASIANALERLLTGKEYSKDDLIYHDELYHSFDHHGSFSRKTAEETLTLINSNLAAASASLRAANILFLTFGTSHVFIRRETGKIVSNCHKISGSEFERRLLSPDEIYALLSATYTKLLQLNPGIKLVLTVSPVRYFAFGHYENSVSKANLFSAIYRLQQQWPQFWYFPAYELVMDDLRDYRFFAEDMLHPNHLATDYVWASLCNTVFPPATNAVLKELDEILLAVRHRPRNPQSKAHKTFVEKYINKMEQLKSTHNFNFSFEQAELKKSLSE